MNINKQDQDKNRQPTPAGRDEVNPENESQGNMIKDPSEWKTGDEPMTGAQKSYLKTLSDEAGEKFDDSLSKAEAAIRITELQHKTGRGLENQQ